MSIESVAKALNLEDPRLSAHLKLTLIGIANHDGDGGAWPSMKTLARYSQCSERQVRRNVAQLEDLGYVARQINAGGTSQTRPDRRPNRFVLSFSPHESAEERADIYDLPSEERADIQDRTGGHAYVSRADIAMSAEPSSTVLQPSRVSNSNARDVVVDKSVRRILDLRQEAGWGTAGTGAQAKIRAEVLILGGWIERWLEADLDEQEIVRCVVARVCDGTPATPRKLWQPPPPEDEPESIDRVRELLAERDDSDS